MTRAPRSVSASFASGLMLLVIALCGSYVWAQQDDKTAESTTSKPAKSKRPVFLRVQRDEADQPVALQVAIARYHIDAGPYAGAYVDLIGAVHVGSKEYYALLNKRFKEYDAMLYELVADEKANKPDKRREKGGVNPVGAIQSGMKDVLELKFQLDEVDYSPKNFVHADMSPDEFGEDMVKRNDGLVNMFARMMGAGMAVQSSQRNAEQQAEMLSAMLTKDPIKMRRAMALQFESMDNQMAGIADKEGKSTLLTERNRKAFEVLERELKAGKRKIGIFYGAGHLLDMHGRLLRDYNAKASNVEWLDAWDLKSK